MRNAARLIPGLLVLCAVALTYSNHFYNGFEFDDFHTITDNVYVRNLANIPKFFTDPDTSSVLPSNRGWRPLVTTSLALDYWLGGGYKPFYFHLSTFFWFLAQLVFMYWLFLAALQRTRPGDELNAWIAWFAVLWYGLNPAIAETVNYIIQRADLMSTCAVVAALALYVRFPARRRQEWYLLPAAIGLLAKPPALIFPVLIFAWLYWFEFTGRDQSPKQAPKPGATPDWAAALRQCVPAVALTVVFLWLQSIMKSKTFNPGAASAYGYLITQPFVALRYFTSFFLPLNLSADTDLTPLSSILAPEALAGFAFLAALLYAIYATGRQPRLRPIAFGLTWFVAALIPTSVFPLAEVENDHRMFFPFVGLALAVTWAVVLLIERIRLGRVPAAVAAGALLLANAAGTRARNEVWHTPESLWRDVAWKSPKNGRGLMNYGLALMSKGDYSHAEEYFERAQPLLSAYPTLETNIGINLGAMGRDNEAELHFRRAIDLGPEQADGHYYFGRWLKQKGRLQAAEQEEKVATAINPAFMDARYLLLEIYAETNRRADLEALAADTRRLAPGDPTLDRYVGSASRALPAAKGPGGAFGQVTPEMMLDESLRLYQAGDFPGCIKEARGVLLLRPQSAEAYNNIAAAEQSMGHWDAAIQAAQQALRINPAFQLAKNNLAWAEQQKRRQGASSKQ